MADNNNNNNINNNNKIILQLRKLYGVLKEFLPKKKKTPVFSILLLSGRNNRDIN